MENSKNEIKNVGCNNRVAWFQDTIFMFILTIFLGIKKCIYIEAVIFKFEVELFKKVELAGSIIFGGAKIVASIVFE